MWTIIIILLVLWALGLLSGTLGSLIHLLLDRQSRAPVEHARRAHERAQRILVQLVTGRKRL